MKLQYLKQTQVLPISLDEAWSFFSAPENLTKITPPEMKFEIVHMSGEGIFAGKLIEYRLGLFPLINSSWVTEIVEVEPGKYFIDEQRFGPYRLWHHLHRFKAIDGGVEMIDEVHYVVPMGFLGQLLGGALVQKRIGSIFEFRRKALEKFFPLKAKS